MGSVRLAAVEKVGAGYQRPSWLKAEMPGS